MKKFVMPKTLDTAMCPGCRKKIEEEAEHCPHYSHEETEGLDGVHHTHACDRVRPGQVCLLPCQCMIKLIAAHKGC